MERAGVKSFGVRGLGEVWGSAPGTEIGGGIEPARPTVPGDVCTDDDDRARGKPGGDMPVSGVMLPAPDSPDELMDNEAGPSMGEVCAEEGCEGGEGAEPAPGAGRSAMGPGSTSLQSSKLLVSVRPLTSGS